MKLILRTLLLGTIILFLPAMFPWWSILIVGLVLGFAIPGPLINTFISGFLSGGFTWLYLAWKIDRDSEAFFSEKMVQLFPFSDPNYLILLTGLIGGMVTGLGTLSGASFRQLFERKKTRSLYS